MTTSTNVAEYQETPKNFKYLTDTPLTKALKKWKVTII
jgi:hypothetical protein